MDISAKQRLVCERVVNVFETGSIKGKYGAISVYNDGPHRVRQITYGRSQTTEYGNLARLVDMYVKAGGTHAAELAPYVQLIGATPLVDNDAFKALLRRAGESDPVMWATQDRFFDLAYFQPALKWATDNGFVLPLSMLVIYDSFIHSGGILPFLRSRFAELTPKKGGDEKAWIRAYVEVRDRWLTTHSNPDLRPSAYRTRDLLREIKGGNWDLAHLPILANGVRVDDQGAPEVPRTPAIPKPVADAVVPFLGEVEDADPPPVTGGSRADILRRLAANAGVEAAAARLLAYRDKYRPTSNPRYWAVVNFDLHSARPRLFLFDCVAGTASAHLCAHGRGSEGPADDGYAEVFSNEDGSNCSSLGIYHCDVTYVGEHGKTLYLDGLEATNSNARRRHIVMHGADYVAPEVIKSTGRIGRSLGCPAIEMGDVQKLIPALKGGSLLIIWKSA
jgi:chitosanase